nr:HNH endonuclease family protein [Arthrobacter sp. ATA002]
MGAEAGHGASANAAPSTAAVQPAAAGTAAEQLETLPIKGRAPKTGYDREQFGPSWADVDRNGCDTRNDILARDLTNIVYKDGTKECVVASGTFADPYTGAVIQFVRGNDTSTAVQIDHIVALSDAWQKGAQQLSAEERRRFANDPLNLMAADGPANGAKSDSDAATWLPPNKAFRCEYVARQIAVKAEYRLWMTQAEHDASAGVLASCPDQPVPAGGPAASTAPGPAADPAASPEANQAAPEAVPVYANCAAVKAAGAAPSGPATRAGIRNSTATATAWAAPPSYPAARTGSRSGVRSAQGRSASTAAPTVNTVASSNGWPTICNPVGMPQSAIPLGTASTGQRLAMLNGAVICPCQ